MKNLSELRAVFYYKNKKYDKAAECYLDVIDEGNSSSPVYLALAACYYNAEKYESAIAALNKAIMADSSGFYSDYANAWKAMALMMIKKFDESYKVWNILKNADEDIRDENYYFCGASCCNELGLYDEALECINKAIFMKKDDTYCLILKGRILEKLGLSVEAQKVYQKASAINSVD